MLNIGFTKTWRLGKAAAVCGLFLAALLVFPLAAAEDATTEEYELKAVFISHFLKYLEWPESAFEGPSAPLIIGILGDDPFNSAIDEVMQRLPLIDGRRVVIERYATSDAVTTAHILFVPRSERSAGRLARRICGRPILTIGEQRGFAEAGGVINFQTDRKRVSFEINTECADAAGIRLSAQLLKLATIVGDPGSGDRG